MGINITPKTDYSYLFSGLSGGSAAATSSFLSDYAAIKNGSYAKLMKAYYAPVSSDDVKKIVEQNKTSDDAKNLAKVRTAAEELKESADVLLKSGTKSVWEDEDKEKAFKAVETFVKDYNSLLDEMDDLNSKSVLSKGVSLTTYVESNKKLLASVGISIESDNSLSLDKTIFEKANTTTLKTLFQGTGSFAYRVSAQSSMIEFAAEREATRTQTYTNKGTYSYTASTGNLYESLF